MTTLMELSLVLQVLRVAVSRWFDFCSLQVRNLVSLSENKRSPKETGDPLMFINYYCIDCQSTSATS